MPANCRSNRLFVLLSTLAVPACATVLPPPRAPERVAPMVRSDLGEPAAGHGRVVLDVADGPSEVREVLSESESSSVAVATNNRGTVAVAGGSASGQTTRPLCTTPCVTDLLRGTHVLTFTLASDPTRTERGDVVVGERVWVQRRALGQPRRRSPVAVGIGIAVSVIGLGVEISAIGVVGDDTGAGLALLGIGAGVAIGGIIIMLSNSTSQPGAVTEWYLDETPGSTSRRPATPAAGPTAPTGATTGAPPARRPRRRGR